MREEHHNVILVVLMKGLETYDFKTLHPLASSNSNYPPNVFSRSFSVQEGYMSLIFSRSHDTTFISDESRRLSPSTWLVTLREKFRSKNARNEIWCFRPRVRCQCEWESFQVSIKKVGSWSFLEERRRRGGVWHDHEHLTTTTTTTTTTTNGVIKERFLSWTLSGRLDTIHI